MDQLYSKAIARDCSVPSRWRFGCPMAVLGSQHVASLLMALIDSAWPESRDLSWDRLGHQVPGSGKESDGRAVAVCRGRKYWVLCIGVVGHQP